MADGGSRRDEPEAVDLVAMTKSNTDFSLVSIA